METQHSRKIDSTFGMPETNVCYCPSQILHGSLGVDSALEEYGNICKRGKSTSGSRLRMKAVRKGSKDQEIFRQKISTPCLFFSEVRNGRELLCLPNQAA